MPRKKKAVKRQAYWCIDVINSGVVTLGFKCSECEHGWQETTSVTPEEVDKTATPEITCPECGVSQTYVQLPAPKRWGR